MSEKFDPYYQWLGIPAAQQPPHHYRLLGLPPFEESPTVIENAADQRMGHLRTFQAGKHAAESQRLLNEVAAARLCLLNPEKKVVYDQLLRQRLGANEGSDGVRPPREDLQPSGGPASGSEGYAFDPGFAEILQTGRSSTTTVASAGRGKKSKSKPAAIMVAVALTAVAVGLAGLWWAFGNGSTPSEDRIAKAGEPATSARTPAETAINSPELPTNGSAVTTKTDTPPATEPATKLPEEGVSFETYARRAGSRARYEQKWSEAAEDLAKAIELKPDDVNSWHHRTMLLVKLQQKDQLAMHLDKMLAKFQDSSNSQTLACLTHSVVAFPTGSPQLVQAGELLANKLPDDPNWSYLVAFVRYRAGKYADADSLFATTGMRGWQYERTIILTFQAMNKARLNDREAAKDLLSKAREAFQKAVLDDHGTDEGDYGEHWWDRLSAEAVLAEAEKLINGAEPEGPPVVAAEKPQRLPVPAADVRREIAAQLEEVYKLSQARTSAQRIKLANDLVDLAEKAGKPEERFVIRSKASELAAEAGNAALMFQVVDRMAAEFELDGLTVKQKLLAKLTVGAMTANRIKELVQSTNILIDQALAEDRFDQALDWGNSALRTCQTAQGAAFRKSLIERLDEIREIKKQSEQIAPVLKAIQTNPQDPDANLVLGQWYCFSKDDWSQGLPYLAKGSDAALQALAVQEAGSPPKEAEGQVKLADAWWDAGQTVSGKARRAILLHAGTWYQEAQPNLPGGLVKERLEKRLKQIAALGEAIPTHAGKQPPLAVAPFNAKISREHQERWAKYLGVQPSQTNSIGIKLVLVPPGEFQMGSPKELIDEELRLNNGNSWYTSRLPGEVPRHRVRITKPFWLTGATVVTQDQYERMMGSNPSKFQGDPSRPVEMVSWDDAVEFCRKLSELPAEELAKRQYALPTEAQWEHACRAGTTTRWYSGDDEAGVVDVAWFTANADAQTHPVGQKRANPWGLYDMHGNVWQWCQDWNDMNYYAKSPMVDPAGPSGGSFHVARGGSWHDVAGGCRSAFRRMENGDGWGHVGLHVALVPADK